MTTPRPTSDLETKGTLSMRLRALRNLTKTATRPWILVTAGTAIATLATLSPVAQHAASAARGGLVTGNHNELLGI